MASGIVATEQQVEKQSVIWGESYGFWCQTGALLLAAIVAYLAIRSSRAIERRKAAVTAIFSTRKDSELIACVRTIGTIHSGDQSIAVYARSDKIDDERTKAIRYALNHYEYVAVGISEGIYDDNIFKNSSYSTIIRLYDRTKPYIEERRRLTNRPTTYQELECLACRWKLKPLKAKPITAVQSNRFRNWLGF
jgi:Domain of unknown function (DUF4760)